MRTLTIILILLISKSVFGQINYCECSHSLFRNFEEVNLIFNPNTISKLSIKNARISLLNDTSNNPNYILSFDKIGNIISIKEVNSNSSTLSIYSQNEFRKLKETKFDYLDSNGTRLKLGNFAWRYYYENNELVKQIQVYFGQNGYQSDSNSSCMITYNKIDKFLTVMKTTYNTKCNNCKPTNYYTNIYTFKSKDKAKYKTIVNDSISTLVQILDEKMNKVKEYAPDVNGKPYYVFTHIFDKENKIISRQLNGSNGECIEQNGYKDEIIYNSSKLPIELRHIFDNKKCILKIEYNK